MGGGFAGVADTTGVVGVVVVEGMRRRLRAAGRGIAAWAEVAGAEVVAGAARQAEAALARACGAGGRV